MARPTLITTNSTGLHPQGPTFAGQDKLPKLPVPPLEDTMARYLKALEGLQVSQISRWPVGERRGRWAGGQVG